MQKFLKKYYIYVIFIAAVAIAVFYAIYQIFHTYQLIKDESITLKQAQMDNSLAEEYIQNVHIFQKNADYINANIEKFDVLMVNDDDSKVRLFSTLEEMATATGNQNIVLSVKKPSPQKSKDAKEATIITPQVDDYLNINVTLVGNYNDLIAFLRKIENMSYMTDILSIKTAKTVDATAKRNNADDDEDSAAVRTDLLKSEIDAVFYLQPKDQ
jgi:type IV pilus assembly protein PilO